MEPDQPGVVHGLHALRLGSIKERHIVKAGAAATNLNWLALDECRKDVSAIKETNDLPSKIPAWSHFRPMAIEQQEVSLAAGGLRGARRAVFPDLRQQP